MSRYQFFKTFLEKTLLSHQFDNKSDQFSGGTRSFQLVELRRPSSSSVEFAETGFFPTPTIVSKNSVKCKCIQKPSNTKKVKKGLIQQLVKQAACQGTNNHFVPLFRQQGKHPNEFEFQGGSKQKRFI